MLSMIESIMKDTERQIVTLAIPNLTVTIYDTIG